MSVFTHSLSGLIEFLYKRSTYTTYLLTYLFTYLLYGAESFMRSQQVPASQKISHFSWNKKVHYRIHKCPPPFLIVSQLDPFQAPTSHFLMIHLNIILPSTFGSPKWSIFPQVSPPKSRTRFSFPPYVLHAPPISFFSILSPEQ